MKSISLEAVLHMFKDRLSPVYPVEHEIQSIWKWVMEDITGLEFPLLLAKSKINLSPLQEDKLQKILSRLADAEPVQYVLGYAWFGDHSFAVQPGVLIPRNETEELVAWIQQDLKRNELASKGGLKVLDIGCGSGVIAISLALNDPRQQYYAADKYEIPLNLTKHNALNLGARVQVLEMDILDPRTAGEGPFDIVVSNPPYVTQFQKKQMADQVTKYEPASALYVPDEDPLLFYRAIAEFCSSELADRGCLYLEMNEAFSEETRQLLSSYGLQTELRLDIHGKPRMLKAYGR